MPSPTRPAGPASTAELAGDDVDVIAPPNHLRGVSADAAYVTSVLDQIDGPVVLVGHSYGGAVITAAGNHEKVAALVYVAGYALDEGETLGELQGRFPDSPLAANLRYTPFPVGGRRARHRRERRSRRVPAHLRRRRPDRDDAVHGASRSARSRPPRSPSPPGPPAWRSKPTWGIVSGSDTTINPDVERFGYERAEMTVTEVDGRLARGLPLAARRGRRGHPRGGRDRGPGRVERTASGPAKVDADGRARARRP